MVEGFFEPVPGVFVKTNPAPEVPRPKKDARPTDWHAEGVDPYEDKKELYEH